jgi:hypothetical protein
MNDNEIIKALEYCKTQGITSECTDCVYKGTPTDCMGVMLCDALDLINRQRAEIERLREIRDLCNATILEKKEQIEKLKNSDASKEECTIRQHNEIKELKAELKTAKAEAIKEVFAKLRANEVKPEFPWDDFYITDSQIKEIEEEMTEGTE